MVMQIYMMQQVFWSVHCQTIFFWSKATSFDRAVEDVAVDSPKDVYAHLIHVQKEQHGSEVFICETLRFHIESQH